MPGKMAKDMQDYIPIFEDQGMKNACGCPQRGRSLQGYTHTSAGGAEAVTFAAWGLEDMASTSYQVVIQNQTDVADEAAVSSKTTAGFTITGPDASDVLDILIFGRTKGQVV